MDEALVNVYHLPGRAILVVGMRAWNGPYQPCGTPIVLFANAESRALGEAILTQFELQKSYSPMDKNPRFFTAIPGIRSWRSFEASAFLFAVYRTNAGYTLKTYVKRSDQALHGDHHFSLPTNADAETMGRTLNLLIEHPADAP